METNKQISAELQEIAPLLAREWPLGVPYRVPAGYFSEFPAMMLNRVNFENEGETPFSDELAGLSPLLAGLQHKNPYQAPAGYFEDLVVRQPSAPVKGKLFTMRAIRYAASACIIALIGMTLFNLKIQRNSADPISGLSNVSEQDIAGFLDSNDVHLTDIISANSSETVSLDFNDNEIHELFSSVSDAELEQYMPALPIEKRNVN